MIGCPAVTGSLDDRGRVKTGATRDFLQNVVTAFGGWLEHLARARAPAA